MRRISAWKGIVIVWSDKGEVYHEVPLTAEIRAALQSWLKERAKLFPTLSEPASFLNLKGKRLSTRAIDLMLRQLGADANVELSAQVLRHTCGVIMIWSGG